MHKSISIRRFINAALAFSLVAAYATTLFTFRASAVQVTDRSITLGSSASDDETSYTISFVIPDPGVAQNIGSVRIEFCDVGPLAGEDCDAAGNVAADTGDSVPCVSADQDAGADGLCGTIATLSGSPTFGSTAQAISLTAPSLGDNYLDFTLASQEDINGDTLGQRTFTVTVDDIDNPDNTTSGENNNSFYARVYVFSATTPTAYDKDAPPLGLHEGGVAMSTANQLTINARVQEVLQFCVGTDDAATAANDCTDISGNTVNLGVIQAGTTSISPVATTAGGNEKNGLAMVRTNAVNGVVIDYFAEQVTGDAGTIHPASLRVSGATCTGTGALAGGDLVDQCFNSAGTTRIAFGATQEGFGVTASSVDTTNGTTTNLVRDDEYCGDGTNGANGGACTGGGWAWSQAVTDRIASSTGSSVKVVDDEMLVLRFAAQASVTTPTGQYGVTSTYIATASY